MQLSEEGGRTIDAALDRLDRYTVVANPDKEWETTDGMPDPEEV